MRQVSIPHYRGLILRKTYPQLSELIDRSYEIYKPSHPEARYNESKHVWTFPSGAKIYFGSMQHTKDRTNYQGKRYDYIDFDELTQFTYDEYSYLFSRNRPNGAGTRCYIRGQANPGGIGHGWVKDRFISAGTPGKPIYEDVKIRYPDGHEEIKRRSRIFIPSTVFDNQKLLDNDPDYISRLAMLPETERNALMYGDWDMFSGQVFTEWRNDSDRYADRINTHVINPHKIESHWKIYRSFDFGYAKPFSVGWYAVDSDGYMVRIRALYGCTDKPNTGIKWEPAKIAEGIRKVEAEDENLKGRRIIGVADPSIYDESRGESVASIMEKAQVYFSPADNTRIAGKMQIHHRLAFDDNGRPLFQVFNNDKHFIRTIPSLIYDDVHVEDIDTKQEDHIYDEFRYICMENPIAPRQRKATPLVLYDPLGLNDKPKYGRYDFYNG